uniref:Proteasome subunit alpha type n=1 Tax=Trepomonas sp. PC1 TaxID=1076344 RepID=A0A146KDU0_9EUKA|eukprot:JAP95000.1 Proteasome subunit alpha type [Trepomonas sp. PC1]
MTYDKSINQFSNEGRVYQYEYAIKSVTLAATGLAVRTTTSTVFVCEVAKQSPLQIVPQQIQQIDKHIIALPIGYPADARVLTSFLRSEAQNHIFNFEEPVPIQLLADRLSERMTVRQTSKKDIKMGRPFGCAIILATKDKMYYCDPAGNCIEYKAKSAGAGGITGQEMLEDKWKSNLSEEEGIKLGLEIVKELIEGGIEKLQAAVINQDGVRYLSSQEIKDILK